MPSFDAFTLTGKSSKCSSRGSEGRTRRGFAILARRLRRLSRGWGSVGSGIRVPWAKGYFHDWSDSVKRQGIAPNLILIQSVITPLKRKHDQKNPKAR